MESERGGRAMSWGFVKKVFFESRLVWGLRLLLSVVFLVACVPKIINPYEFALALFRYRIFPYYMINFLAIFVPWLEFVVAIALLLWSKGRQAALIIIVVMLFLFTVVISSSLLRGLDIACGCFSVRIDAAHIGWISIVRNISLLFITVSLLYTDKKLIT